MTSLNLPARVPSRYLPAKVNNRNTRTRCEICPKLTIKIPEQRHWRVFIVNFENISPYSSVSVVKFEHAIASWVESHL